MDFILADYYAGAYGPTIRLQASSLEALRSLRSAFMSLAAGQTSTVRLRDLVFVESKPRLGDLCMSLRPAGKEPYQKLRVLHQRGEGTTFEWSRSSEGWIETAELLDGLLTGGQPAHQYLTREDVDDALVEVSYGESVRETGRH